MELFELTGSGLLAFERSIGGHSSGTQELFGLDSDTSLNQLFVDSLLPLLEHLVKLR